MNDGHEEDYQLAHVGRIGADRMALGLPCLPDKLRGDMEVVAQMRIEIERAREELGGFCQPPFDGSLVTGIRALSMRCAAAETELAALRGQPSTTPPASHVRP